MGYMMAMDSCFACGQMFSFNPNAVPSYTPMGARYRRPVCRRCMELVNERRKAAGLPPHPIRDDAYEPTEE